MIYNPWGFSTSTAPTVQAGSNTNTTGISANVQQNNARGYLDYFNIYVYNPTSASASANITIYLYSHLPETDGSSGSPVNSFTFSSGGIDATSGAWLNINPNIFWEYNTLVAIPEQTTQASGTAVSVAFVDVTSNDSHTWAGSRWGRTINSGYNPVAIYWGLTNTAPASLPVTVQGGEVAITGTTKIY